MCTYLISSDTPVQFHCAVCSVLCTVLSYSYIHTEVKAILRLKTYSTVRKMCRKKCSLNVSATSEDGELVVF